MSLCLQHLEAATAGQEAAADVVRLRHQVETSPPNSLAAEAARALAVADGLCASVLPGGQWVLSADREDRTVVAPYGIELRCSAIVVRNRSVLLIHRTNGADDWVLPGGTRLDRMLFTSTRYPVDYGFIPGTQAEDGDPLDAMVLLGEPAFPGTYVTARPVAVFWMTDEHGPDAKILAVPARDPRYESLRDLPDIPAHLRAEISHFFNIYKDLEPGKSTDVRGWQGRTAAEQEITAAFGRGQGLACTGRQPIR
jgi:inorganic pyrophosphatase